MSNWQPPYFDRIGQAYDAAYEGVVRDSTSTTSEANDPQPDTLTLTFRVKPNREGVDIHRRVYGNAAMASEMLISEAISAWFSEGLVIEAEGRRTG